MNVKVFLLTHQVVNTTVAEIDIFLYKKVIILFFFWLQRSGKMLTQYFLRLQTSLAYFIGQCFVSIKQLDQWDSLYVLFALTLKPDGEEVEFYKSRKSNSHQKYPGFIPPYTLGDKAKTWETQLLSLLDYETH